MDNEKIKISDEFFSEIKMLQGKFQEVFTKLGNLGVEKIELDRLVNDHLTKEKSLKEEWINLQKLEQSLLDKIVRTYGEGNLNMSDGTFTPTTTPTSTAS